MAYRQGVECGFQGRTNKLVDGCYSFWQGGVSALVQRLSSIVEEQLSWPYVREEQQTMESTCSVTASDSSEEESSLNGSSGQLDDTSHFECEDASDAGKLSDIGFSFLKRRAKWGPLFHSIALQQYILLCSQVLEGGFRDKPGKVRDFYHSCYCLSGLSVCQYSWSKDAGAPPLPREVLGPYSNLLKPIHPLFNVVLDRYYEAHDFFSKF